MNLKQFLCGAQTSFPFRVLSGEGLDREITDPRALVCGGTEDFLSGIKRGRIVIATPESLNSFPVDLYPETSFLFLSGAVSCPPGVISLLVEKSIPLVASSLEQEDLASRVAGLLREKLESTVFLHGSMVVFKDIGVLVTGESGAGKSRCCLDLLSAGARLVADDLVEIKKEEGRLFGKSPEQIRNMIEIRGTGISDVRALFGERAAVDRAVIDIAFEISGPGIKTDPDSDAVLEIMGIKVPLKKAPADCRKPVSEIVRDTCEERCRDNYR